MKRTTRNVACAIAAAAAASATPLFGQDEPADLAEDIAEGSRLELSSELLGYYTDNFFNQPELKDEALGTILKPAAVYSFALPRFRLAAAARGEFGWFGIDNGTDNDYVDGLFSLAIDWNSAMRHRFGWGAAVKFDHDPLGTERTEVVSTTDRDIDEWRRESFNIKYHYGIPTAPINLEAHISTQDKEYTNNRRDGLPLNQGGTRFLDHEKVNADATVLFRVSLKTAALLNVVSTRTRYEEIANFDRGADELRYRAGLRWQATAKTTGDVRVGVVNRETRDSRREDFNEVDWQVSVGWVPRSTTHIGLQSGRRAQESYLTNVDFLDNRYYNLSWAEHWTTQLKTTLGAGYIDVAFVGSPNDRRDDLLRTTGLAEFLVTRELSALGSLAYTDRQSSAVGREFEKLEAYLGLRYLR